MQVLFLCFIEFVVCLFREESMSILLLPCYGPLRYVEVAILICTM